MVEVASTRRRGDPALIELFSFERHLKYLTHTQGEAKPEYYTAAHSTMNILPTLDKVRYRQIVQSLFIGQ